MIMYALLLLMIHNMYMTSNNKYSQLFKKPTDLISGRDNRYPNVTENRAQALDKLERDLEKLRLLRTLEDVNTNEITKLLKIECYKKNDINATIASNLHCGDLFEDWNFEEF